MLVDLRTNAAILGSQYDAKPEDVLEFFDGEQKKTKTRSSGVGSSELCCADFKRSCESWPAPYPQHRLSGVRGVLAVPDPAAGRFVMKTWM